jgi:hypothetical protein
MHISFFEAERIVEDPDGTHVSLFAPLTKAG